MRLRTSASFNIYLQSDENHADDEARFLVFNLH